MSTKVSNKVDERSEHELPPKREGKATNHDVSVPLAHTPLSTVVYAICAVLLFYFAYCTWWILHWKNQAGGWVNFSLGRTPTPDIADPTSSGNVEVPFGAGSKFEHKEGTAGDFLNNRMSELAEQLGIEPKEFASAIKPLVDPTKAAALEADPEVTGDLADVLVEDIRQQKQAREAASAAKGFMDTMVGMDAPPSEMA